MTKKWIALAVICLCSACQGPTESNYYKQVQAWLGKTPEELVTRWGTPHQVIYGSDKQYYIYMTDRVIPLPATDAFSGINEQANIQPILEGTPAYQTDLFCQTTFVVQNDEIVDWMFEGNACKAY